jgi:hypothetical protein
VPADGRSVIRLFFDRFCHGVLMTMPLYITGYDDKASFKSKRASYLAREIDWSSRVPMLWRSLTIGPLWVNVNRDEDAAAERWMGYDEEDQPCYCRYLFRVPIDSLAEGGLYKEDLAAWRMRDGRWLIHRVITCHSDGQAAYAFYTFSESMPR